MKLKSSASKKLWKQLSAGLFSAVVVLGNLPMSVQAQDAPSVKDILNYKSYTPMFSSAGQPTREQLPLIKEAGYQRVIYIAFSTIGPAIPEEDQLVKELGMDYLHIPVDFNNPTIRDFNAFADAMQREPDTKTLLHCQVNARATAFSFLYRVIYDGVSVEEAKRDMNTVWQPNAVWRDFIWFQVHCEFCSSISGNLYYRK